MSCVLSVLGVAVMDEVMGSQSGVLYSKQRNCTVGVIIKVII